MAIFRPATPLSPTCTCNGTGLLLQHTPAHSTHLRCLLKHFLCNSFTCPTCTQPVSLKTFANREILVGGLREGAAALVENADQAAKAFLFSGVVYACISIGKSLLYPG
ncbi:MAG: hypothetical protein P0S96_02000 [Simkaniaceae bacterium]|nr:hypothetical protein [Candidatus Sacchlamyda saccharinae]